MCQCLYVATRMEMTNVLIIENCGFNLDRPTVFLLAFANNFAVFTITVSRFCDSNAQNTTAYFAYLV